MDLLLLMVAISLVAVFGCMNDHVKGFFLCVIRERRVHLPLRRLLPGLRQGDLRCSLVLARRQGQLVTLGLRCWLDS